VAVNPFGEEAIMKKSGIGKSILVLGCLVVTLMIANSVASAQEIPKIKAEELRKLLESKADIIVVDNQPKGAYEIEHIPGAINFPWAMQIKGPVSLPRDKMLILYCACEHEEDSTHVAEELIEKFGYVKIKLLEGGWLQWVKLGYPIEKK
jgi:rhodanese-related sulfurtransferase